MSPAAGPPGPRTERAGHSSAETGPFRPMPRDRSRHDSRGRHSEYESYEYGAHSHPAQHRVERPHAPRHGDWSDPEDDPYVHNGYRRAVPATRPAPSHGHRPGHSGGGDAGRTGGTYGGDRTYGGGPGYDGGRTYGAGSGHGRPGYGGHGHDGPGHGGSGYRGNGYPGAGGDYGHGRYPGVAEPGFGGRPGEYGRGAGRPRPTRAASSRRVRRRRRQARALLLLIFTVTLLLVGVNLAGPLWHHWMESRSPAADALAGVNDVAPSASLSTVPSPAPSATASEDNPMPAAPGSFPASGPGTFRYDTVQGPVLGYSGPIERFRVAIETNVTMVDMDYFANKIDKTLGDSHSWIAGRTFRLQRVPQGSAYDFTIYLATQMTTSQMCSQGGVAYTNQYTSCRTPGRVILNLARWLTSVPYYTDAHVSLDVYRTYMINHETGHQFGHGHELCPGPGRPAPVMQQQTLGLHGCLPNPWPYLDGKRYAGPPGSY